MDKKIITIDPSVINKVALFGNAMDLTICKSTFEKLAKHTFFKDVEDKIKCYQSEPKDSFGLICILYGAESKVHVYMQPLEEKKNKIDQNYRLKNEQVFSQHVDCVLRRTAYVLRIDLPDESAPTGKGKCISPHKESSKFHEIIFDWIITPNDISFNFAFKNFSLRSSGQFVYIIEYLNGVQLKIWAAINIGSRSIKEVSYNNFLSKRFTVNFGKHSENSAQPSLLWQSVNKIQIVGQIIDCVYCNEEHKHIVEGESEESYYRSKIEPIRLNNKDKEYSYQDLYKLASENNTGFKDLYSPYTSTKDKITFDKKILSIFASDIIPIGYLINEKVRRLDCDYCEYLFMDKTSVNLIIGTLVLEISA